ncbi:AAA family ATPase [Rickettsia argasii]|uniref:CobQ/CobB/MinD/ParA nucleotide binding domain protein n=1 Tax=Rickettsia argasii T170-B TaxID=1268837 RepID=A0A0F3RCL4_9RICK|nr:AAA family ATPase [Rickettsia argasii]KJW03736.1 cobQ/CobB/MinD/ParA nucleotide binding domain protein [Rickettsia argasii T170-B]
MIVLIGGEKGGTGKTTIATNLATIRMQTGHDVLLVDTDKQGSASAWSDIRDLRNIITRIPNIQKFGTNLASDIRDLRNRYEDIIIDAGGRDSIELRAAMTVADIMYIPVQASQFDIWTLSIINDLVAQAQSFNTSLQSYILINRASTNPVINEVDEALSILNDFDHLNLSKSIIKERICYRKAAKSGLSIVELDAKDNKAIKEITMLYEEIFSKNE